MWMVIVKQKIVLQIFPSQQMSSHLSPIFFEGFIVPSNNIMD